MGWFREFRAELKARRRGRKYMDRSIQKAARHIIGPTGWNWSNSWDHLDRDGDAYLRSFDPKVPRSIFLSKADENKANIPVPLVERCIEEAGQNAEPPDDES